MGSVCKQQLAEEGNLQALDRRRVGPIVVGRGWGSLLVPLGDGVVASERVRFDDGHSSGDGSGDSSGDGVVASAIAMVVSDGSVLPPCSDSDGGMGVDIGVSAVALGVPRIWNAKPRLRRGLEQGPGAASGG